MNKMLCSNTRNNQQYRFELPGKQATSTTATPASFQDLLAAVTCCCIAAITCWCLTATMCCCLTAIMCCCVQVCCSNHLLLSCSCHVLLPHCSQVLLPCHYHTLLPDLCCVLHLCWAFHLLQWPWCCTFTTVVCMASLAQIALLLSCALKALFPACCCCVIN